MTTRFMVYVDVPVVTSERHTFVVVDEDDLKNQLSRHEATVRVQPMVFKTEKNVKGKVNLLQLSSDWDI